MKIAHTLLVLLATATLAHGQGQFVFNNRIGAEVNARFVLPSDATGTSSIGTPDYYVQLFGGPIGTPESQLLPLDPSSTTFRGAAGTTTAGYVVGVTPTVPGVPVGGNASVLLRLVSLNGYSCDFGPYTVNGLGGGTTTPPNLQLGTSPLFCVPEPSSYLLGAAGMAALAARGSLRGGRQPRALSGQDRFDHLTRNVG